MEHLCYSQISVCVGCCIGVCIHTQGLQRIHRFSNTVVPSRIQMSIFTIHTNRIPQWGLEVGLTFKKVILYGISFIRYRVRWKEGESIADCGIRWRMFVKLVLKCLEYVFFFSWSVTLFKSIVDSNCYVNIFVATHSGFGFDLLPSLAQFLCLACLNILPSFSSPFSSASSRQIKLGGFDWRIMHNC